MPIRDVLSEEKMAAILVIASIADLARSLGVEPGKLTKDQLSLLQELREVKTGELLSARFGRRRRSGGKFNLKIALQKHG